MTGEVSYISQGQAKMKLGASLLIIEFHFLNFFVNIIKREVTLQTCKQTPIGLIPGDNYKVRM